MAYLQYAEHFADLIVYQKAKLLSKRVFELTRQFPKEETFALTDQIRRSSRSIGAQIAEAWAKRRYEKHFISKLTDADGEQLETQHWIDIAVACKYLSAEQADEIKQLCLEIGRMLGSMIAKAHKFCSGNTISVHDEVAEYFAKPTSEN